ncbi:flagellin [Clostridium cavendishii DSM 21758]|uniref:Flagellin n=1 Tax=Clostridium cavendishii DSM 21758 TaxID=1121302 RepID=A0A1M6AW87_9CLOT|nr:flagellin [Clostridium cavendishii]SHI40707.1 flagellin [Clostridium cavendishii DSM 21758]
MRLYHNMMSMNLYKTYKDKLVEQSGALNRISTGSKINSAKDNPNKIGQSELMRMQIRGLQFAQRNLQDGSSMMQTVDGALGGVSDSLTRMKELVIASGNAAYTDEERSALAKEFEALKGTINDAAKNTEFNGVKLLDCKNPGESFDLSAGANVGEKITIPLNNITTDALKDENGNSLTDVDLLDSSKVGQNIKTIDDAIKNINNIRSKYGAIQGRLDSAAENAETTALTMQGADSRVRDADIATEMINFSKANILVEASTAMMAQSNKFPQDVLRILERMK